MKAVLGALTLALAAPAFAQGAPGTPLFASDEPIRITIRAPISSLVSDRTSNSQNGTLEVAGTPGPHPVTLSARGITRLRDDICPFPPLRVDFSGNPPAGSLFAGQNRLKLVTHCRPSIDFQQKVLLEYTAYRLYNALTPLSYRARLANIDYVDAGGRPYVSRVGFFIEDIDDVARRNGMVKVDTPDMVPLARIDPRGAARVAMFNYMLGNLDWSVRAGPPGEGCCHNARLVAASPSAPVLTPVPYDFDFSGFVDAPYATPPEGMKISNVRQRVYRGYCRHDTEARVAAAEITARRADLGSVIAGIPGLDERNRRRAVTYLDGFFKEVEGGRLWKNCLG